MTVHALGVYLLNWLSLGCWSLLCPFNHPNLTFNHSNLTTWPVNLTTCPVPNRLMIWIFFAPHLAQCAHYVILSISWRHGEPDRGRGATTDDALPSLLTILWRTFSPWTCVSVCENAPWSRAANTRRDTTTRRHANTMWNVNARGEGNTRRDCWMKIEFRQTLTVKYPKFSRWCHDPYARLRTLSWFSIFRFLHSLDVSEKIIWFRLSSHHTNHPFCGRLIYST